MGLKFNNITDIKSFLDDKVEQYNQPKFIEDDPIVIPHQFSAQQDIELMGFFASILAWGLRKTIISKCRELIDRMDGRPYQFVVEHKQSDLKALLGFKHRTFNDTDLLHFIRFFKHHYNHYNSLEDAFIPRVPDGEFREEFLEFQSGDEIVVESSSACFQNKLRRGPVSVEEALNYFKTYFFNLEDSPARTKKHISSPLQNSTCKRLNMFLRWMVRRDDKDVDFGIWSKIKPNALICPCDVHVDRVARKLGLIERKQTDWKTAVELTENLKTFDPNDPVKYDFALFGLGVEKAM